MFAAAGNSGPGRCSIGTPGAAASAVTVGAGSDPVEAGWGLAPFSSRGLTADGRLKPDIVTPGVNITTARAGSSRTYVTYSSTSMAAPVATDVGTRRPGCRLRAGPAAGLSAAQAVDGSGAYDSGLSHGQVSGSLPGRGQSFNWSFTVTDTTRPIAVTLLMANVTCSWWSCSPDFDLYLISPSGATVGRSEGTTRQEQILYQSTVAGTYRVRVYAYNGSGPFWLDTSYR
jgi:serine protease AprX